MHMEVTRKIIADMVSNVLDPARVKKARLEVLPTKEQVEQFDENAEKALKSGKKDRQRAKKQALKADKELASREDEVEKVARGGQAAAAPKP